MEEVRLKELYPYDTISQDKGWERVYDEVMKRFGTTEVTINFDGINIVQPWKHETFIKLLKDTNINIVMTNNFDTVNCIKMACILDGLDESRISSRTVEITKPETAYDRKIREQVEKLLPCFKNLGKIDIDNDNDVIDIMICDKYSQLGTSSTVDYIKEAILRYSKDNKDSIYRVQCGKMDIQSSVLDAMATMQINLKRDYNIDVEICSDIEDNLNKLGLYIHKKMNDGYDINSRYKAIKALKINEPGILIKYKLSRAVDDFGRHGNGKVVSSRIAMFKGITQKEDGTQVAIFWSYNSKTFYTKEHWALEHDGEALENDQMRPNEVIVGLMDLGLFDKFIGSQYHFLKPIQNDISENITMQSVVDGSVKKHTLTIPERMKVVFDDWHIKYNEEEMNKAIELTRKHLASKK